LDILDRELQGQVQTVQKLAMEALIWELGFLKFFLVANSQKVLWWFAEATRTHSDFLTQWGHLGDIETQAVLNAITQHGLVDFSGGAYQISAKGQIFLNHFATIKPIRPETEVGKDTKPDSSSN